MSDRYVNASFVAKEIAMAFSEAMQDSKLSLSTEGVFIPLATYCLMRVDVDDIKEEAKGAASRLATAAKAAGYNRLYVMRQAIDSVGGKSHTAIEARSEGVSLRLEHGLGAYWVEIRGRVAAEAD